VRPAVAMDCADHLQGGAGGFSRRPRVQSGDSGRLDCDGRLGAAANSSAFVQGRGTTAAVHLQLPSRYCHPLHNEHGPLQGCNGFSLLKPSDAFSTCFVE